MWDLPGPRIKLVSPALAGGFLTAGPPRKPEKCFLSTCHELGKVLGEQERHGPCSHLGTESKQRNKQIQTVLADLGGRCDRPGRGGVGRESGRTWHLSQELRMRRNPVRGCWGRGTRQSYARERELGAVTEGKASGFSWSRAGRDSWSGRHKRGCGDQAR